ncbi:uncharacterized protein METZ01_LOCUS241494, partial [marine metagenome]
VSLKHLLQQASEAYYKGKPIMPDYQFDELSEVCNWRE